MRYRSVISILTACLALGTGAGPVHADGVSAAESLYEEGNRLYDAGDYLKACPKYEASVQLAPESIDSRGRLALCYEKLGRLASAWSAWREVRSQARRSAGRGRAAEIATEHIKALEPRLGFVTFALPAASTAPVGLAISLDGSPLPVQSLGTAVALDRGSHRVEMRAPGYRVWSVEITSADAVRKNVELGPLEIDPAASAADPLGAGVGVQAARHPRPARTRVWLGLAAAGAGVMSLGVGAWAGIDGKAKRDDARTLGCSDDLTICPEGAALDTANDAYSRANLATVAWIAGAALVAGGAALWLTAPSRARRANESAWWIAPSATTHEATVGLVGRW